MKYTILIADDDDGYRFPIKNMFEDYDYECIEASRKEDILGQASRANIWVIDARLPTGAMEGIQAVIELADTGTKPQHPVVFISVIPRDSASSKLSVLENKGIVFEWIEKPFELELLLEHVQRLLNTEGER